MISKWRNVVKYAPLSLLAKHTKKQKNTPHIRMCFAYIGTPTKIFSTSANIQINFGASLYTGFIGRIFTPPKIKFVILNTNPMPIMLCFVTLYKLKKRGLKKALQNPVYNERVNLTEKCSPLFLYLAKGIPFQFI